MTGALSAPRSLLAVPASRVDLLASARRRPADALMLDLEDGVAPDAKAQARAQLLMFLDETAGGTRAPSVLIRVGQPSSDEGRRDLKTIAGLQEWHREVVRALVVPKADGSSIATAAAAIELPLVALVETAAGIEDAADVARNPAVVGLLFGSVDYAADVSRHGGWHFSDFSWVGSRIVNAAAAGGSWALAGPCTRIGDPTALADAVRSEAAAGFAGKLCIHPGQLESVNAAFSPRTEDIDWARRVIDATGGVDGGAVKVDGQMIDRPLIEHAQRLLHAVGAPR